MSSAAVYRGVVIPAVQAAPRSYGLNALSGFDPAVNRLPSSLPAEFSDAADFPLNFFGFPLVYYCRGKQ